MRRLALALVLAPAAVLANADPPSPPAREDRIEGPFATLEAYCAMRGGTCEDATPDEAPAVSQGQAIRAYRFVSLDDTVHVAVQTAAGWYGRAVGSAGNGDGATIETVKLADVARDPDAELLFDLSTYHDPCACADLYHSQTYTFVCTIEDGALRCTDAIEHSESMHLVDIWSYASTLSLTRRGKNLRVARTITESDGMRRSALRRMAAPFTVTFHR